MATAAPGVAAPSGPTLQWPSIPVPTADVNALYKTCMALKQAVDMITNQKGDQVERIPHIWVQDAQPADPGDDGDFWLCTQPKKTTLSVMQGGTWHTMGTVS